MKKEKKIMTGLEFEPVTLKKGYKQTKLGVIPEDWEIVSLGEIGVFKNGINKSKDDFGFGVPFVNLMDVFGIPRINNTNFGLVNASSKEQKLYNLIKGDVLFIRSSVKKQGVGLTSLIDANLTGTVYSGFIIRFRLNDSSVVHNYKEHCFYETGFRNRLMSKSSTSANTNINQESLKKIQIPLPPKPQQQKIAKILNTWDIAINKQKQLITAKQKQKKALMQLLLTGKKRFDGFLEVWKEVRLSEIGATYSGGTPLSSNKKYYEGNIPFIGSGNINDDSVNQHITDEGFNNSSAKLVKKGDLLYALYGATSGEVGVSKINGAINQAVLCIRTSENITFLYQYLLLMKGKIVSKFLQGGQGNLSAKIIKNLKIELPNLKEQKKIAQVLSTADQEIKNLEKQLSQLIQQKQSLMQVLLTGKVLVKV